MPVHRQRTDPAWRGLALSLLLHAGLAGLVVSGAMLFPGLRFGGGHSAGDTMDAVSANLVSSLPGAAIPLPAPVAQPTVNRLASASAAPAAGHPGAATASRNAIPISDALRAQELTRQNLMLEQELARTEARTPNQVPYGNRGPVSGNFGSKTPGGGMNFGDASFGTRYGDWINRLAAQLRVSWNAQYRDPSLPSGGRVVIAFTVDAAGAISKVRVQTSSGRSALDEMGVKAVQAMIGAQLFPLPAGYSKSSLDVGVTFELSQ